MITVYPIPRLLATSPYLDELYRPLEGDPDLTIRRIPFRSALAELLGGRRTRIAHWHFFDELTQHRSLAQTMARTLAFMALIKALRLRAVGLIWTAHNLEPHELRHPAWARRAYVAMGSTAHALIAHSAAAAALLAERYPIAAPIHVIPHGAYIGHAGPRQPRAASRAALGLPATEWIALNLGVLRPYKGLELLIEAWAGVEGRLLLAGAVKDPAYSAQLRTLVAGRPAIQFHPHFVADADLPTWLGAADVLVLPYRKLLTSGMLLWALSYGVPVVAPDTPPVRELIHEGREGFLFTPGDAQSLRAALLRARAHPDPAALAEAAYQAAQPFAWPRIAERTAAVYRAVAAGLGRD